jgi:flagellar biosynthesis GTPase FlhF
MKSIRRAVIRSTIWFVAVTAPATFAAAGQAPVPDPRAPTSIELALAEYACGPQTSATTDAAHFDCLSSGVRSIRTDFGYNLIRLSASQRNTIDKSCGPRHTAEGRDGYLACVSSELRSLRTGKAAPTPAPQPDPVAALTPAAASVESSPRRSSSTWVVWLIGLLGVGVVFGGGIRIATRAKASCHRCRSCGTMVAPTADLCMDCRKQAAEAIRHAAAERAERERADQERERPTEPVKEQHRAQEQDEARLRQEHEEQRERAREEEEARLREEQVRLSEVERQREDDPAAARDGEAFDPHAILGVLPGAGPDAVAEAYRQARSKYDPSAVEFLGDEVRSYYTAKADAVERAYRLLSSEIAYSPHADASTVTHRQPALG